MKLIWSRLDRWERGDGENRVVTEDRREGNDL